MLSVGIDIGSITTKIAVMENVKLRTADLSMTGYNSEKTWKDIFDKTLDRLKAEKFYAAWGSHPSKVATAALKGLRKNKRVVPTPKYHVVMNYLLYRLWPSFLIGFGRILFNRGWNFIGPLLK